MNKGAYDKEGVWWDQEDIKVFTSGVVRMRFGCEKGEIVLEEWTGKNLKQ